MKSERNILVAFLLNLAFSILQFLGGLLTNSVAIMTDSIHGLGDAVSVGLSYILERLSKRGCDKRHSYGYARYSVLGSAITMLILTFSSVLMIVSAVQRIIQPGEVDYSGMIVLAIVAIVLKSVAALVTRSRGTLNQKAISLHMLEDVLSWVIVLVGAIIMNFTDISIIDPIMSIGVALFILYNAIRYLRSILVIFLEKTPDGIELDKIEQEVLGIKGVSGVHHIHVRSMDGFNNYATLHVVVDRYSHEVKEEVKHKLAQLGIAHATVELELKGEECEEKECRPDSFAHEHGHGHRH
ncbi:cation transporter [Candidatus Saccharibacteria bacterium]|nr:cation transporter [Candidatus Saccharibacteria bacterium]